MLSWRQVDRFRMWFECCQGVIKNLPANAGDVRDASSIPGSGRSPGAANGNTLQYSCLKNPMHRGAWRAIVHGSHRVRHDWASEHTEHVTRAFLFTKGIRISYSTLTLAAVLWWRKYQRQSSHFVDKETGGHKSCLPSSLKISQRPWKFPGSPVVRTLRFHC